MKKKIILLFIIVYYIQVQAQIISYNIKSNVTNSDTLLVFDSPTYSYGISIEGNGQLLSDTAFIRVVLVDNQNRHWLVYERNDLYSTEENNIFQNAAFETSLMDSIIPRALIAQINNAILNVVCVKNNKTRPNRINITNNSDSIFLAKNIQLVERINNKLSEYKKAWRADTTFLSNMRYQQRKMFFNDSIPNLRGWDYYAYGYYSPLNDNTPMASDDIVKEFDWRTRHGAMNSDSYYYNPDGYGWIPRRRYGQVASECWAFSVQYATEALVNLYFNRQLNDELSVQDILSCSNVGSWNGGGSTYHAMRYVSNEGIVADECFPFVPRVSVPCDNKCSNPVELVKIGNMYNPYCGEVMIKENIITKGLVVASVKSWGHAMCMVGFGVVKAGDPILYGNYHGTTIQDIYVDEDSPDIGKPYYIFKQSYAFYGYDKSPFCNIIIDANNNTKLKCYSAEASITSQIYDDNDILCVDNDGDGYYNWGIGSKPTNCPNCPDSIDSDDSSPLIGPYKDKYESVVLCDNYAYSNIPEHITQNTYWGSKKYINHDIIIESGITLTIKNTIYMGESTRIIVKPGGRLILGYNAKITGLCDNMWQGIEVWGNRSAHQYAINGEYLQGYLEMKNGATIENAVCAVELWNPNHWNATGGIIHATNAVFRNNTKAVHALYYSNFNPINGKETTYNSWFKNCDFIVDDNYLGVETFYKHVDLAHINGISFKGCDFSVDRNVSGVSPWCMGIGAYGAGVHVTSYCENNNVFPCPDDNIDRCTFTGFNNGVLCVNNGSNFLPFTVRNAVFTNNNRGIFAHNTGYATILNNEFNIGDHHECNYGVYADGVTGFCIEENIFRPATGTNSTTYGIGVFNSKGVNDIYRNIFEDLTCGNVAYGINRLNYITDRDFDVISGLTYSCNENNYNDIDFYVLKDNGIGGIRGKQGSTTSPAGNTFSGRLYHFFNDGDCLINYYYNSNESNETPNPSKIYRLSSIPTNTTNNCISHYGNGRVLKSNDEITALSARFQSADDTYSILQNIYESRIDGGNTSASVSEINNATSTDMWTLRNKLLGNSPYVSKEVLARTIDRDDVFSSSILFEILSANPDELKRDTLINYIESKNGRLPDYMIEMLRQIASGVTPRTALTSQIAEYAHDRNIAACDIVRSFLNDTVVNLTTLRQWLGNINDITADRMAVATYVQEGDFLNAISLANTLPNIYNLQENDLVDHNDYMVLLNIYQVLYNSNRTVHEMTVAETEVITDIAYNGTGTSQLMAKAIMMQISDQYVEPYICPDIPRKNDRGANINYCYDLIEDDFTAYLSPSPANTWVSVEYNLPDNSSKATLTIINTYGVKVMEVELIGNMGSKTIEIHDLAAGIYTYIIKCGEYMKTGKLVVNK